MAVSAVAGLASAIGAAAASLTFFTYGGLTAFVGYFALGAGLSALSRALAPTPKLGSQMRGLTQTSREPAGSRKLIYGQVRVGGQIVFIANSGTTNEYLHLVIVYAAHEIESFEEFWFNDNKVYENNAVTSDWSDYVTIAKFDGSQTAADSTLTSVSSQWTSNHILNDMAYAHVRLKWDQDKFPQGVPNISAVVKGKKVYDPRDSNQSATDSSTWTYSQNPALCVRDYLVDTKYGLGEDRTLIDSTALTAAANLCDESISLDGGGTQNRYKLNGQIDTANQVKDNIEQMLSAMGGRMSYSGGKYFIAGAEYTAPTISFDEADCVADIQLQTKQSRRGAYNGVKGIFVSEEKDYKVLDYPAQISSTYAIEDGDPIYLDMALPFVTNNVQAQRIAKIALLKSRQQTVISMVVNLKGLRVKVGDTINVSNTHLGYSNKVFEIIDYSLAIADGGNLAVNLTCIETASAIYDWTTSDQEDFLSGGTLPLYDGRTVDNVTSLTATEIGLRGPDGALKSSVQLAWTGPSDAFVEFYTVRYNKNGTTEYFEIQTRETNALLEGLDINSNYDFRVKAQNLIGVQSTGTSIINRALNGDTTAPSAPTSVVLTAGINQITCEWTNPTDIDLAFIEVHVTTTSATPSVSATPTAKIGGEEYIATGLSEATRYFHLRAVDFSGNKSAYTTQVSATSLLATGADIGTGAVDTDEIATGAVTEVKIEDGAVTADKITVGELSAITADIGNITAGTLQANTSTPIPDANDSPSGSETGAFIDLDNGKFVFGDANKHLLYDGSTLLVKGELEADILDVIDATITGQLTANAISAGAVTVESLSAGVFAEFDDRYGTSGGFYVTDTDEFFDGNSTKYVTVGTVAHSTDDIYFECRLNHSWSWPRNDTGDKLNANVSFEYSTDNSTWTTVPSSTTQVATATGVVAQYATLYSIAEDITYTMTGSALTAGNYYFRVKIVAQNSTNAFQLAAFGGGSGVPIAFEVQESSGLSAAGGNADTLDGLDSTQFLRSDTNDTFNGDLTITGQLILNGSIDQYNVTDLDVTDKTITVNSGNTQSLSDGAGLIVDRGTAADASITWDETNDEFDLSHGLSITGGLLTSSAVGFGVSTVDPDAYGSYAGGFGNIADGSGWGARGLFIHGGGTGDAAAIGHNGSNLYFGIQNGSTANSMDTWLTVNPTKVANFAAQVNVSGHGNSSQWNTAYTYSQVGHLPLAGGTMTGTLNMGANNISNLGAMDTDVALPRDHVIKWQDGGSAYSNIIKAGLYPSQGFTGTNTFWIEYAAKGGHNFIVNTDGGSTAGENSYDHFTVWQGAVDGRKLFWVTNSNGDVNSRGSMKPGGSFVTPTASSSLGIYAGTTQIFEGSTRNLKNIGSINANDLVTQNNTTIDSQGPYDWVTVGSGSRAAALRINDIAGANYLIRAGGYGLRFMKHVDAATDSFRDIMRFTATGVGDTTPHVVISNNLSVGGTLSVTGSSSLASVNGTYFSDGYVTWNAAQFNRSNANIELQFNPASASAGVRIGGNTSNPIVFDAYNGTVDSEAYKVGGTEVIASTRRFYASNGTVAKAAFSFDGESSTGMYKYGTNQIGFTAGGSLMAYVQNVSGSAALVVQGQINASGGNSGNWNTAYGWGNHATAGYISTSTANTYSAVQTFEGSADANWRLHLTNSNGNWDALTFQGTNEWGDGQNYGVLGGDSTEGFMMRRPHVVWNSNHASADIRLGRSGGLSSGAWVNMGIKASSVGFLAYENANVLTWGSTDVQITNRVGVGGAANSSYPLYVHGSIAQSSGSIFPFGDVVFSNNSAKGIRNAAGDAGYRPDDAYGNTYAYNTVSGAGYYGDFGAYYFRDQASNIIVQILTSGVGINTSLSISNSSHNYLYMNSTSAYEQMVRFKNSLTSDWYAGIRTSAGIASTADFHIYSAFLGDDAFALTTSGDLVAKRNLNTKTGSVQINGTSVISPSRNASLVDGTFTGTVRLTSGTGGTTNKLIFKTSDNVDENKYIRTNAYYMEFHGHANEGFKFTDTSSNNLLTIFGGNNTYAQRVGINTATPAARLHVSGDRIAVASTSSTYGQLRIANTTTAETSIGFFSGATESTLSAATPTAVYRWAIGLGAYTGSNNQFVIGNISNAGVVQINEDGKTTFGETSGLNAVGRVRVGTDTSSGWGTTVKYPWIGSDGTTSLIMLQNPHVVYRTDNARSGASGRSGLRMARDAGGNWWDMGLIGDEWELYRSGTGQLLHMSNAGKMTMGLTASELRIHGTGAHTRKIVLYDGGLTNNYRFYGFGVETSAFINSIYDTADTFYWYAGASNTSRSLAMSLSGTGNVVASNNITANGSFITATSSSAQGIYAGSTQVFEGSTRNLKNIGTIGSSGQHSITGGSTGSILLKIGSATQTEYVDFQMVSNSGVAEFFKNGTAYTGYGGASSFNMYNSNGLLAFHPSGATNVLQIDSTGLNVGASRTIRMNGTTVIDSDGNVLTNTVIKNPTDEDAQSGTWVESTTSTSWGSKYGAGYAYTDTVNGFKQFNIPSGMNTCYMSQLQWSTGGYVDIHGVQSDGDLVFLKRVATYQHVEHSNHGDSVEHDGNGFSLIGSNLGLFTAIRITNKEGRFHFTGLKFTKESNPIGDLGVGTIHGNQIGMGVPRISGLSHGTTTIIDASRNLVNIGNATFSGTISSGGITALTANGSTTLPNVVLTIQANTTSTITTGGGTAIKFKGVSSGGNIQNYDQAMIASVGQSTNNAHGLDFYYKPDGSTALTKALSIIPDGTTVARINLISHGYISATGLVNGASYQVGNTEIVSSTRRFYASSGTSVKAAYSFDGESNTGWYKPAAGEIAFISQGVERLHVKSTGELEVPTGRINIDNASVAFDALLMGSPTQTSYTNVVWYSNSANAQIWLAGTGYTNFGGASALNIYNSNGILAFHPQGTQNVLQMDSGGLNISGTKTLRHGGNTVLDASRNLQNITSAQINGAGGDGAALLAIAGSASSNFNWASKAIYANLTSGEACIHLIGQAQSTKNSGYIGYRHSSAGSNANALTFGHYSADHQMQLYASGQLAVNPNGTNAYGVNARFAVHQDANLPTAQFTHNSGNSTYGASVVIGNNAIDQTLIDGNQRPMLVVDGKYPVINLNHTSNTNDNHGPTIQFTFEGLTTGGTTGRQIVIGPDGAGNRLDFGFSGGGYGDNSNKNPHNGIAGYLGVTPMRLFYNGLLLGSTGAYPNEITSISHALDIRGHQRLDGNFEKVTYNKAFKLYSSGTASSGSAIGFQQVTAEGWTGIFVDYNPYEGWGLYHDNPSNYFYITAELSTGNLGTSFTVPNRDSGSSTAYAKIRFNQNNGDINAGGAITANGNVTAYASDRRLKTNFRPIESAVEKVNKLNGLIFDWNDLADANGFTPDRKHDDIGLIAQEVQEVVPQAVELAPFDTEVVSTPVVAGDKNSGVIEEKRSISGEDYLTVKYEKLVPLLVSAIKEQADEIAELKAMIKEIKDGNHQN